MTRLTDQLAALVPPPLKAIIPRSVKAALRPAPQKPAQSPPDDAAHSQALLAGYLEQSGPHCLQIGSGLNHKQGWLNSDVRRTNETCFVLDARKPFQLPSDTFDYIHNEHIIEHITYAQGRRMVRECYRVLKPGGVLRTVTPSIAFLLSMYQPEAEQSDVLKRYMQWIWEDTFKGTGPVEPTIVFNGFQHLWGHQFIYDHYTLRKILEEAGFARVVECPISESEHAPLRNLEFVQRMPAGFLELESMQFEATK